MNETKETKVIPSNPAAMGKPIEIKPEVVKETKEVKTTEFNVYNSDNYLVRTYTEEIHGEDAGKLAKQFAIKINGSIK